MQIEILILQIDFQTAHDIYILSRSEICLEPANPSLGGFFIASMPHRQITQLGAGDVTLAGSLISSPIWASWLADFNELLTTMTLVIGVILGLARLWAVWVDRRKTYGRSDAP
jgi:hypothetical protein